MSTAQDRDIAIWVCPHGYSGDVVEFPLGGPEPSAKVCGTHGAPLIRRCPNPECSSPTYHPSDLDQNYHKPCGAAIPWADARKASAQALLEYDTFNSSLIGRSLPELTPQERQDLIVPPSGRLPAERVRAPVSRQAAGQDDPREARRWLERATSSDAKDPPRVTAMRGSGSHLSDSETRTPRKTRVDSSESRGPTWNDTRKTTWDQLEAGQLVKVAPPAAPLWQRILKGWWDLLFGSLQNAIGGLILIFALIALAVYFGVKIVQPQ